MSKTKTAHKASSKSQKRKYYTNEDSPIGKTFYSEVRSWVKSTKKS